MRSLLFVPGNDARKLDRAFASAADALLLDLEDSVAPQDLPRARETVAAFLRERSSEPRRMRLFVRVNGLASGEIDADLDAVLPAGPDGILLPKANDGRDVTHLDAKLAAREALFGLADGSTRVLVLATETPQALFRLGTFADASRRLEGMAWGAEDLSAALGAESYRDDRGEWLDPYRLARALCLLAAVAAGVAPIDGVYTKYRDLEGLEREAIAARRDGFTAKLAIHPAQVEVINRVFTPDAAAINRAKAILAAFAANPGAGVVGLDGEMVDRPHLRRAETVLARARLAGLFDQPPSGRTISNNDSTTA